MAPSEATYLAHMKAVPAAWPLDTVLDAWAHTACFRHYDDDADFQNSLDLLEQRLTELWEPKAAPNLAAELLQRGRAELQRCSVQYFTNEGLVRWNEGSPISSWSWLEAPCQRLAQRLTALTESTAEEAKKRRRVEEDISAAHELQRPRKRLPASQAEAEVRASKDEVAQHKERCGQLEARVLALDAAAAENAAQLRASETEREQLAERLASAEASAFDKAVELQQAHDEIAQLEQRVAAAEAAAAESLDELRKVQSEKSECLERCQQLESRLAKDPAGGNMELKTLLIENAKYEERCDQLKATLAKAETKLDQMQTLWEQKGKCQVEAAATYKERCRLLEQQLTEAKEQASHMSARFPAHPTFARRGPAFIEEASSSPESNASDSLGYVLVEDASSELSRSSWFSVQPHCFMLDAIFKTRSYGVDFFLMGRDLKKGSQVVAGDDETILEVAKSLDICRATEIVRLQAGEATLQVTQDHLVQVHNMEQRVMDVKEAVGMEQYVAAGTLKEGDLVVLDSGEPVALTSVESWSVDREVLKIVFEPDLPVACFSCPPCILSKGHRKPSIRRPGVCRRGKAAPDTDQAADCASIPVTSGEYMD